MSNGAPPLEQKPPGPTEPTLPQGAGPPSGEDERKEEKCRKTEIKRVYDDSGKYWVDVEQLKQGSFMGAQWAGPEDGNQTQETILNLSPQKLDQDCGDKIGVGMNPSNPIIGSASGGEGKGPPIQTDVPSRKASYVESRNNIRRKFATKKKPECCKDMKRRVAFNNIEEKYLKAPVPVPPRQPSGGGGGGDEGEHPPTQPPAPDQPNPQLRSFLSINDGGNGGGIAHSLSAAASGSSGGGGGSSGSSGGKVPPKDPKEYKKAVKKSKDGSDLYLDICITKDSKMMKTGKKQEIRPKDIWKNGKVHLPPFIQMLEDEAKRKEAAEKKAVEEKTKEDAEKGPTGSGSGGGGAKPEKEDTSTAGLTPAPKGPFFKLDPYQAPINFGPDALAVEFYDGAGPGIDESQITP